MKRFLALTLLLLLSLWNGFLIVGFLHDASVNIIWDANYYAVAFGCGLSALGGIIVIVLVLIHSAAVRAWLILWIVLTAVSITLALSLFFSPMGKDSLPVVFFFLPQALLGLMIVVFVTRQRFGSVGRSWPIFLGVTLLLATICHATIPPAKQVIIYGNDDRPQFELYVPQDILYYMRPFSAAVALLAWGGTLLQPIVAPNNQG